MEGHDQKKFPTLQPPHFQICSGATVVKLAPSSGLAIGSSLITAAAGDCRAYIAAPPTSPCSQVFPGRRDEPPSGDLTAPPALSLRAEGTEALVQPPCTGEAREENFPSQVTVVGDEVELTFVAIATYYSSSLSAAPLPKDVARGFALGPLILARDLSSIPRQYLIDWGVCPNNLPNSSRRTLPYALIFTTTTSESSRSIDNFLIALMHQLSKLKLLS